MTTNKSGKIRIYLYVLLTIAGCVFACSSIIPNDYIKLVVVMGTPVSYTHLTLPTNREV